MDTGERTHSQAAELGALVCVSLECVCSVSCAIAMAASLRPDGRPSQHYFFFMLFGVLLPVGFVSYNRAPFSHHSVMLAIAWCCVWGGYPATPNRQRLCSLFPR